ncbi:MAG: hypothetical protein GVY13_10355 [Alphaproteobacteria bacterium]|jgi:hypothetical protein|nr:hypothetical protein [Alphaproteobacteria bacterium]
MLKTVSENEFMSRCRTLMDEVAVTGDTLLVTRDGQPMVEIHPATGGTAVEATGSVNNPFADVKGAVEIVTDLDRPDTDDHWEEDALHDWTPTQ